MKAKANIQLTCPLEHHRVFVILLGVLIISATCFAQTDKSSVDSQQYYSLEDEITLLNQAMKLRVTIDILAEGNNESIGILGSKQSGIQVTLSLENKGTIPVNWTLIGGSKPKNSEVILVIDGKKEIAPIAEKAGDQKGGYRTYQTGTVGLLSTNSTKPGEKTEKMFLFSKPKKGSNAYIKIRQRISGVSGYEPLFPKEGIDIKINLTDKN